jgi:serpin B
LYDAPIRNADIPLQREKAMKRIVLLPLLSVLAALFLSAGTHGQGTKPAGDIAAVVKGDTEFALRLYGQLGKEEGNLFFSPFSISTALAMTYAGARGDTADEMAKALDFTVSQDRLHPAFAAVLAQINEGGKKRGYQLSVANALWGQQGFGFLPDFLNLTRDRYGAGLHEVDFVNATEAARKLINAWVEKETQDKIKDLLPPGVLTVDTRLVLTNAIYFKGFWAEKFKKEFTHEEPFKTSASTTVKVPLMQRTGDYLYLDGGDFQALELPYQGKDLSMVVLLPKKVDGLGDFEQKLTEANLTGWLGKLRKQEVQVALPQFKMTKEFSLNDALKALGMRRAFIPGGADFTGMSGSGKKLFISAVVHKAFVDVNEEGTEAAAATGVVINKESARITPVFQADHPFVFLIRDNRSGSVLFMGRLSNPA